MGKADTIDGGSFLHIGNMCTLFDMSSLHLQEKFLGTMAMFNTRVTRLSPDPWEWYAAESMAVPATHMNWYLVTSQRHARIWFLQTLVHADVP